MPGTTAGNDALGNEKSKSWTLGLVLAPPDIPGLRASIDWTDIRIESSIVSTTLTQLFATCYDNDTFGSNDACNRFARNPATFQINSFRLGFLNAAERRFSGLLADVQYKFSLGSLGLPGSMTIGGTGFYTRRNEQRINRGDLDILAGERGFEKYKVQGNFQYAVDGFSALWQVLYTSSGKIDAQASSELRDPGTFGAFWQHDLGLSMDVNRNLSVRFTVTNIFDAMDDAERITAKATNAVIGGANLFSNLIGRSFSVGAKVRF